MLVNDIEIYRAKILKQDEFNKFVTQPPHKRGGLLDTVKTILQFNETIQLGLT